MVREDHCRMVKCVRCYYVPEVKTCCVPYTTCKMVPEEKCQVIKCHRCKMVPEEHCCQIPYVTCRMVPEERCCQVPVTTCSWEPYCVTRKVYRCVPVCVPVCPPPCSPVPYTKLSNAEWFARVSYRAVQGHDGQPCLCVPARSVTRGIDPAALRAVLLAPVGFPGLLRTLA
jgi:hypothetical protein